MSCVPETSPPEPESAVAPDDRKKSDDTESNPSENAALPEGDNIGLTSDTVEHTVTSPTTNEIVTIQQSEEQVNQQQPPKDQTQLPMSTTVTFTTIDKVKSGREMLAQSAQDIVEELNNKRTQDTQMIADFKAGLELHTQRVVGQTEENLFKMYEKQSAIVQEKIQELNETLQRISQLESEMQEFKQALGMLYVDMNEK